MTTATYPAETNNLVDTGISHADTGPTLDWNDPALAAIIRIRLVTDPGFPMWDVSYVLGRTHDGTQVRVRVPFHQVSRRRYLADMISAARTSGVYLKGLCGGDIENVVSRLW